MSKFKEGDDVICVDSKNTCLVIGEKYKVVEVDNLNGLIKLSGVYMWHSSERFRRISHEFKTGDKVEVSQSGKHWSRKLTFIGMDGDLYVIRDENGTYGAFIFCRHPRKEYTLKECADALGVPVDDFRIKDE